MWSSKSDFPAQKVLVVSVGSCLWLFLIGEVTGVLLWFLGKVLVCRLLLKLD